MCKRTKLFKFCAEKYNHLSAGSAGTQSSILSRISRELYLAEHFRASQKNPPEAAAESTAAFLRRAVMKIMECDAHR